MGGRRRAEPGQREGEYVPAMRRRRHDPCGGTTDMVCFAEVYIMINCRCRADYGGAGQQQNSNVTRRWAKLLELKEDFIGERQRAF
jgi:hypothetical protein